MSSAKVPEDIKSFLRSVLVSTNGVKECRVESDYRALSGEKLNWRKYGFPTLHDFLSAIPDVCCLEYNAKEKANFVYAVKKEGVYMSSHAQKNAKTASKNNNSTVIDNITAATTTGRKVRQDGESLKITIDDVKGDTDGLKPNVYGLYQVYVTKLPMDCTEMELQQAFSVYGDVIECDVIISSAKKKVGFVRYLLKQEAAKALNESKVRGLVIRGHNLEVGLPKKKKTAKSGLSDDTRTTNQKSPPSSPSVSSNSAPPTPVQPAQASASSPPPKPQPLAPKWQPPSELPQTSMTMPKQRSTIPKNVTTTSPTVPLSHHVGGLRQPLISVHISGYNNQISKEKLQGLFKVFGNIVDFDYHPSHTIVSYNELIEAKEAVSATSGRFIDGCVLLVKILDQPRLKFDHVKNTTETVQKQSQKTEDSELDVYGLYEKVVTEMCGPSFKHWLHILPSQNLDIRFMDIVDPLTYWVHIYDKERDHQFTDLTKRLQCINPTQNQTIGKNEFGAGRFTDDGKWYRCYCFDVSRDQSKVHVIYIDYGNTEWLDCDRVVRLPKVFLQLHSQGVLVKISGFTLKSNESGCFDEETVAGVMELFLPNIQLFACKTNFDSNKPLVLNIDLYSDTVKQKLCSLPGIEAVVKTPERVLLTPPPLAHEGMFEPFKECLTDMGQCVVIWIVHITSPTTFYFQLANTSTRGVIFQLIDSLTSCSIENKVNVRSIGDGDLVCYHSDGLERSRVCLAKIGRSSIPGHVDVLHVDIGKPAIVPCDSFVALPMSIQDVPYQARPAQLFMVPERDVSLSEVHDFVNREYRGQVLRANIVEEKPNGTVMVELFDRRGYSLNKRLLEIIESNTTRTTTPEVAAENPGPTLAVIPQDTAPSRAQKPLHVDDRDVPATQHVVQQSYDVRLQSGHGRANSPTPSGAHRDGSHKLGSTNPASAQNARSQSQDVRMYSQDVRAQSQKMRGKSMTPSQDAREQSQDLHAKSMTQSQDDRVHFQDVRSQSQDVRSQSQDVRSQSQDVRSQSQDVRSQSQDVRSQSPDVRSQSQDARSQSPDVRSQSPDVRSQSQDARSQSKDVRSQSQDARGQSQNIRARPQVSHLQSQDIGAQMPKSSQDVRQKLPDTRSQSQVVRAPPQTKYAQQIEPHGRESEPKQQQNRRPLVQPLGTSTAQTPVTPPPTCGEFDELPNSNARRAPQNTEVVGDSRQDNNSQTTRASEVDTKTHGHSLLTEKETKKNMYPGKGTSINKTISEPTIRPGVFTIDGTNAVPRGTKIDTDHNKSGRTTKSSLLPSPENVPVRKSGFGMPTNQPFGDVDGDKHSKQKNTDHSGRSNTNIGFSKSDFGKSQSGKSQNVQSDFTIDDGVNSKHGRQKMTDPITAGQSNTNLGFSKSDFGETQDGKSKKDQSDFTIDHGATSIHGRQKATDRTISSRPETGKQQHLQGVVTKNDSTNSCKVVAAEYSPLQHEDIKELTKKIEAQEKILSKPKSDQKTLIVQHHMKEKLELQVRIRSLENEIFSLKNKLKELSGQKATLQRQVSN